MSKSNPDPRVLKISNRLREKINKQCVTENDFLTMVYLKTIKSGSDTFSMDKFKGRCEFVRLEKQQRPEKLALLEYFFDSEFSKDSENMNNVDAAFYFDSEVSSRVALRALDDHQGCDKTALNSVYSLVGTYRDIIKKYKASCSEFRRAVEPYIEMVLSPFLSKWHVSVTSQDYKKHEFRSDLKNLQAASTDFLSELRKKFSFLHSISQITIS